MLENFKLGLEVTGWGMGLVFLALLIVMLAIYVLDRIFKPEVEPKDASVAGPGEATQAGLPDLGAEAVAIAVAIALEKRRAKPAPALGENLAGEVVTVTLIDPGSPNWRSAGRLRAMR